MREAAGHGCRGGGSREKTSTLAYWRLRANMSDCYDVDMRRYVFWVFIGNGPEISRGHECAGKVFAEGPLRPEATCARSVEVVC